MTLRTVGTLRRKVNKGQGLIPKHWRKTGDNILSTLYTPWPCLSPESQEMEQLSMYPGCPPTPAAEGTTLPMLANSHGRAPALLARVSGCRQFTHPPPHPLPSLSPIQTFHQ